jgi:hypothetical protein
LNQERVDRKRVAVAADMRVGPMSERRVKAKTKRTGSKKDYILPGPILSTQIYTGVLVLNGKA